MWFPGWINVSSSPPAPPTQRTVRVRQASLWGVDLGFCPEVEILGIGINLVLCKNFHFCTLAYFSFSVSPCPPWQFTLPLCDHTPCLRSGSHGTSSLFQPPELGAMQGPVCGLQMWHPQGATGLCRDKLLCRGNPDLCKQRRLASFWKVP